MFESIKCLKRQPSKLLNKKREPSSPEVNDSLSKVYSLENIHKDGFVLIEQSVKDSENNRCSAWNGEEDGCKENKCFYYKGSKKCKAHFGILSPIFNISLLISSFRFVI